jgi:hypothetical protein
VSGNYRRDDAFAGERSGVERTGWMLRGLVGLLMLGVWDPGAVPQLLRGVVVFDCANSNYRKHAKGSVSALVSLGVTLPIAIQGSGSGRPPSAGKARVGMNQLPS